MRTTLFAPEQGLDKGFNEILKRFPSEQTLRITAHSHEKTGFILTRHGDEATVLYAARADFFAALGVALSKTETEYSVRRERFNAQMGIMLDIARVGSPTPETLQRLLASLSLMGYNYAEIYTEDVMQVEGEPFFGYMRGRLTQTEIKQLDAFAAQLGIELVPCIQTLAHLNSIFRHPEYNAVHDCNDILLIDEPRTYELLENIFKSCRTCFTSNRINIGMDEAHMVGLGKYLDKHGFTERFALLKKHLEYVLALCDRYGYRADMWSDMFFRLQFQGEYLVREGKFDPSMRTFVPQNVNLLYWDYYNTEEKNYDFLMKMHAQLTDSYSFAGGAWRWVGFAPLITVSEMTLRSGIEAARKNNVSDVLITSWSDDGAEGSPFSVLSVFIFAAAACYGNVLSAETDALCRLITGYGYEEFRCLELPNAPHEGAHQRRANAAKYLLYIDPLVGNRDVSVRKNYADFYAHHAATLQKLAQKNSPYAYLFETLYRLCDVLQEKSTLGFRLKKAFRSGDKTALRLLAEQTIPELLRRLDAFTSAFTAQWDAENRPFGFEVHDVRLGGLRHRLTHVAARVLRYVNDGTPIAELDECADNEGNGTDDDTIMLNAYGLNMSYNKVSFF